MTYAPKCRHLYKTQTNTITDLTTNFSLLDSFKSSIIMSPLIRQLLQYFPCASLRVVLDLRLARADVFFVIQPKLRWCKIFYNHYFCSRSTLTFPLIGCFFSFYKCDISASDVHTTLLCVCEFICKNQDIGFFMGTCFPTTAQYFPVSSQPS